MSHYLRVRVVAVETDSLTCELPDGTTIQWPRDEHDTHIERAQVGDELTLTLTHTRELINELLDSDYGRTTE